MDSDFPVLYAVMSGKTQLAVYVKVFEKSQELAPQFAPQCAVADFEEASVSGFQPSLCQCRSGGVSYDIVHFCNFSRPVRTYRLPQLLVQAKKAHCFELQFQAI